MNLYLPIFVLFVGLAQTRGAAIDAAAAEEASRALAAEGEFPFLVSLHKKDEDQKWSNCSGTLLSDQWVLTTAYCARHRPGPIFVKLGCANLNSQNCQVRKVTVNNIFVYKGYNSTGRQNDIALLKMGMEIKESSSVRPVKSLASYSTTQLEDGVQFVLAGWYRRKGDRMKQTGVRVVEHAGEKLKKFGYKVACVESDPHRLKLKGGLEISEGSGNWVGNPLRSHMVGMVSTGSLTRLDYHRKVVCFTDLRAYKEWIGRTMRNN